MNKLFETEDTETRWQSHAEPTTMNKMPMTPEECRRVVRHAVRMGWATYPDPNQVARVLPGKFRLGPFDRLE